MREVKAVTERSARKEEMEPEKWWSREVHWSHGFMVTGRIKAQWRRIKASSRGRLSMSGSVLCACVCASCAHCSPTHEAHTQTDKHKGSTREGEIIIIRIIIRIPNAVVRTAAATTISRDGGGDSRNGAEAQRSGRAAC